MSTAFLQRAVPGVQGLKPYQPGKPVAELEREYGVSNIIKLASNENPLGPGAKAMEVISRALPELARYPDGNGFDLKMALAKRHDVDPACITLGNGSNVRPRRRPGSITPMYVQFTESAAFPTARPSSCPPSSKAQAWLNG